MKWIRPKVLLNAYWPDNEFSPKFTPPMLKSLLKIPAELEEAVKKVAGAVIEVVGRIFDFPTDFF